MGDNKDEFNDNNDQLLVRVFDFSDDYLKALGEVCTNENSRKILMVLAEEEMYVNQIAIALDLRVSLVLHHLKKLKELGFLIVTSKPISKKTKSHNFYKTNLAAFTVLLRKKGHQNIDDVTHKNNMLKRLFKNSVKFAGIGIAGVSTWILTNILNNEYPNSRIEYTPFSFDHILFPALITAMVIGFGLVMFYCSKKHN